MTDFDADAYLQSDTSQQAFDPDAHLSDTPHKYGSGKSFDVVDGQAVPTGSKEAKQAQQPTSGMDNFDKGMAGAGKSVVDMGRGLRQLWAAGADFVDPKSNRSAVIQSEIDQAGANDRPLMHTAAGDVGYLGGALSTSVIPGGLIAKGAEAAGLGRAAIAANALANPSTYAAAAGSGALYGFLQPTETGDSRALNTSLGAAGGVVGNAGSRAVSAGLDAIKEPLTNSATKAVKALVDAGVPLDAAQRTGSVLWNRAKIMLSDNPLTSGQQAHFQDMQQKAINKAFLSTIGETANAATPDVMNRAMTRLSNTYDDVASRTQVKYDHMEEPLSDIMNNARLNLNDQQFATIQRNADNIINKASNNGQINGEQFGAIKRNLDNLASSSDSDVASVGRDMRQALNDALLKSAQESGNTADVALLKQTNQQWRNMRTIEGAIDKEGGGDISPARLANIMGQKANRSVSIYGRGDTTLSDLAQSANELLPNKTPNSGTAARLAQQAVLPAVAAGIGAAKEGNWKGAATGAVVGAALPKAIQKALQAQGGRQAIDALGRLVEPSALPAISGGAVQKLPGVALNEAELTHKD